MKLKSYLVGLILLVLLRAISILIQLTTYLNQLRNTVSQGKRLYNISSKKRTIYRRYPKHSKHRHTICKIDSVNYICNAGPVIGLLEFTLQDDEIDEQFFFLLTNGNPWVRCGAFTKPTNLTLI